MGLLWASPALFSGGSAILLASPLFYFWWISNSLGFSGNLLLVDQQFSWLLRQFTSGGSAILLASPAIYFWWISNSLGFSDNLLLVDQQFSWLFLNNSLDQYSSGLLLI